MKKNPLVLTMSLAALIAVSACSGGNSSSVANTRDVVDLYGRTITVPKNPERVVCIGAGMLRYYVYVCGVDNLVGVEDIEKNDNAFNGVIRPYRELHKAELTELPTCGKGGPTSQVAEPETILTCSPDIILSMYGDDGLADELQQKTGVPVVTFSYGGSQVFSDYIYNSFSLLGEIFDKSARTDELVNYIKGIGSDLDNRTKDIVEEDKPSIYLGCLGNYGMQDIYSSCKKYSLFEASGIKNAIDDGGSGYVTVDKEYLVSLNMDKMILDVGGLMTKFKTTYEAEPATFDAIKAIADDEVYVQMPYNAYYTNLEVAYMDAYYDAMVSFPEQFSDIDIAEKSDEITKKFLGVEYYDTIATACYGGFGKFSIPGDFSI